MGHYHLFVHYSLDKNTLLISRMFYWVYNSREIFHSEQYVSKTVTKWTVERNARGFAASDNGTRWLSSGPQRALLSQHKNVQCTLILTHFMQCIRIFVLCMLFLVCLYCCNEQKSYASGDISMFASFVLKDTQARARSSLCQQRFTYFSTIRRLEIYIFYLIHSFQLSDVLSFIIDDYLFPSCIIQSVLLKQLRGSQPSLMLIHGSPMP